jgi:hypothetical protein
LVISRRLLLFAALFSDTALALDRDVTQQIVFAPDHDAKALFHGDRPCYAIGGRLLR